MKKRASQFARKGSGEHQLEDSPDSPNSPIDIGTKTFELNLKKIKVDKSDGEMSPIEKLSQAKFPFLQTSLRPFTPMEVKLGSIRPESKLARLSLKQDKLKKRVLTNLSQQRPGSPDQNWKFPSNFTHDEYSHLPRIERNASESSRLNRPNYPAERSFQPQRPHRDSLCQNDQLATTRYTDPNSKLLSSSVRRLNVNKERITEFDKRIQRMKVELDSMRKSCL